MQKRSNISERSSNLPSIFLLVGTYDFIQKTHAKDIIRGVYIYICNKNTNQINYFVVGRTYLTKKPLIISLEEKKEMLRHRRSGSDVKAVRHVLLPLDYFHHFINHIYTM